MRDWWNPRNKRFWLLLVILLYTLAGFLLAPWVIQSQVIPRVAEQLGRPVSLDELHINPYVLSVEARGLRLTEDGGAHLFGFDRLFVNFQLSSLFRRAWTFRELRLDKPLIAFTREASGDTNFGRLLADITTPNSDPSSPAAESELVRLVVSELAIEGGIVELTDFVPVPEVSSHFEPINININNLTTLPAESGQQQVLITVGSHGRVAWSGSLQLNPLLATGRLEGSGHYLPIMYRYVEDLVAFEVSEGQAEFAFDYKLEAGDDGEIAAQVDDLDFSLRDIGMRTDDPVVEFLSLPELSLTAGRLQWPEQTVQFGGLDINGARLHVIRNPDGVLNLQQLVLTADELPVADPGIEPEDELVVHPLQGWLIVLGELNINDFGVAFEDQSLQGGVATTRATVNATVRDISSRDDAQSPFQVGIDLDTGGSIAVDGQLGLLPAPVLDSALQIDQLALQIAQPWVAESARVEIDAGRVNADTRIQMNANEVFSLNGSLNIESLDVSDVTKDERLIGWQRLAIDELAVSATSNSFEISEVSIVSPYVSILIAEDQTTNFEQLVVGAETVAQETTANVDGEATASAANAPVIKVGQVIVADGSADFTDLSLPLPFAVRIGRLQGQVSTLATDSSAPADIDLEGQVGEFGLTTIAGRLLPGAPTELTDIQLEFRNLTMADLSPYTVKFAGRRIDDGKLDVTLKYLIESGALLGENNVLMRDLILGEKIDHPNAASLPLSLAVALLKRPDGTIDIDLPVSGDVNDPEFSIGGLVFKTFVNLITKAATSPFRLLGGLVGVDAEGFDQIEFRPGRSELTPPELEKLLKLTEALTMRPGLGLELRGTADPDTDAAAIKAERVAMRVESHLQMTDSKMDDAMLTRHRREVLEKLVRDQLPDLDITLVKGESMRPKDPANPDGKKYSTSLSTWPPSKRAWWRLNPLANRIWMNWPWRGPERSRPRYWPTNA